MITGFGNNISSALASDITANQTAIRLVPGGGALFAKILTTDISNPNSPHGVYAKLTITDSQQTVFEICHLTAVSNDTLTVIRGQEGTTAKGWALNDVIANFATRGSEESFVQVEQLQGGDYTSATAGGTPNALAISLPSTFGNNNTNDWLLRTPLLITPVAANSGDTTLQLTLGGRVIGTFPLYKGNKAQLDVGDLLANVPFICLLDSTKTFFTVVNPINLYSKLGTAAFKDVQTSKDDTASGRVLVNDGTFVIGTNQVAVHTGDMEYQFKGDGDFLSPGGVKAFNGSTELAQNAIFIRGTGNKHLWFYSPTGDEIGLVYASDDKVLHMRAASGPSADVDAGGNLTLNGEGVFSSTSGLNITGQNHVNGSASASAVTLRAWGMPTGDRKTVFEVSDATSWLYYAQRVANGTVNMAINGSINAGSILANNNINAHNFYTEGNYGAGGYANQMDSGAPFYQNCGTRPGADNTYFPLVKGRVQLDTGYPTAISFGMVTGGGTFPSACIQLWGDNKNALFTFSMDGVLSAPASVSSQTLYAGSSISCGDTDSGMYANGDGNVAFRGNGVHVAMMNQAEFRTSAQIVATTDLYAGGGTARYGSNGDINGAIWGGGWLSTWVNQRISDVQTWANGVFLNDVALGAQGSGQMGFPNPFIVPVGNVMTGWYMEGQNIGGDTIYFRPIQKKTPASGWVTVGHTA